MERLDTIIQQNDRLYELFKKKLSKSCVACKEKHKKRKERQRKKQESLSYTEDQLMTIDMAVSEMNVSRSTIYNLIDQQKLKPLKKLGKVRLIKAEVMAAKQWYSIPKGKL